MERTHGILWLGGIERYELLYNSSLSLHVYLSLVLSSCLCTYGGFGTLLGEEGVFLLSLLLFAHIFREYSLEICC